MIGREASIGSDILFGQWLRPNPNPRSMLRSIPAPIGLLAAGVIALISAGTASAQSNITINGDFELGDDSGWQYFPTPASTFTVSGDFANTGSFGARLVNLTDGTAAVIKQPNLGAGQLTNGGLITGISMPVVRPVRAASSSQRYSRRSTVEAFPSPRFWEELRSFRTATRASGRHFRSPPPWVATHRAALRCNWAQSPARSSGPSSIWSSTMWRSSPRSPQSPNPPPMQPFLEWWEWSLS